MACKTNSYITINFKKISKRFIYNKKDEYYSVIDK